MPEPLYECWQCHRTLIPCPRCGQLLHDLEQSHMRTPFMWCTGKVLQTFVNWARVSFEA